MINTLEEDAQRVKEELQGTLSALYFSYLCSLLRVANGKLVLRHLQHAKAEIAKSLKYCIKYF